MTSANEIRAAMEARGMKPIDLLIQLRKSGCEVTEQTVNAWLDGRRTPRYEHTRALRRVFGLPASPFECGHA